jgi:hypothetical protein
MTDNDNLDLLVKLLMVDLADVLYKHGIKEIHVGALMRLIGVNDKTSAQHDNERIDLSTEFSKYVQAVKESRLPDQTIH